MMCVKAELITKILLSDDDKKDMLNGDLNFETLALHVKVWVKNRMPYYRNGKFELYEEIKRS